MSRKLLIPAALGAVLLFPGTALLAASGEGIDRSKSSPRPSQELSGRGDATPQRGGGAPGEFAGDAASANPEARLSDKSAESERLIENPEKQNSAKDRADTSRPEPRQAGPESAPGPSIKDRSSEVR